MRTEVVSERLDAKTVEDLIRGHPSVEDCVVLVRPQTSSGSSLVAYVVPIGRFRPDALEAYVRSSLSGTKLPDSYVPISRLPLTNKGEIDKRALASVAVIDEELLQRIDDRITQVAGTSEFAVVVQDQGVELPPVHLSDLLPDWKAKPIDPVSPPVGGDRKAMEEPRGKSALSEGGRLLEKPGRPSTLPEALIAAAAMYPQHGVRYINANGLEEFQTYPELLAEARRIFAGLQRFGLKPQDKVLFQLELNQDFIPAFWGCMLGGFVPIPLAVPTTFENNSAAVGRLQNAWQLLGHPLILAGGAVTAQAPSLSRLFQSDELPIVSIDELRDSDRSPTEYEVQPDDVALMLLTSGSTGLPKAVVQHHQSILSRSAATASSDEFESSDVSLNWFPLDHVGGLVMFHVRDVLVGCQQIQAPIQFVLEDPLRWLDLVDRYRVSITWAPNFAFGLVTARHEEIAQKRWDLASLRFILNGGEAIVAKTARRFLQLLAPHGLPPSAMRPAWGMSETCSGVTSSHRFSLETTADTDQFVEVGAPLPGVSLRIVDDQNQIVDEGSIGSLQIKGPMVTSGYFENADLNREAFSTDGWFITGDLGVLREGRLTITGRQKDVIIINGINIPSHEIEAVVEGVPGVAPSYTAACAVRDAGSNTDNLIVFFHAARDENGQLTSLLKDIRGRVVQSVGVNPTYLIPVPKEAIPKTEIGKIQRTQLRNRFLAGEFDSLLKAVDIKSANANTLPEWFFRPIWRRKAARISGRAAKANVALVFQDAVGLGECVSAKAIGHVDEFITVVPGSEFARLGPDHYQIAPDQPSHYLQLIQSLRDENRYPDLILHCWTYGGTDLDTSARECLERDLGNGLYSLLFLIRTLAPTTDKPIRLFAVSSDAQPILDSDRPACARSMIPPILKSASLETPYLDCRHVDLPADDPEVDAVRLYQELTSEGDAEVAFRNGHRMVPRLERVQLQADEAGQIPFKTGATYLISGGLGGIGVELAKYLLQKHKARVLLIGRTRLPDRSQWSSLLKDDAAFEPTRILQMLERVGEVRYESADVADVGQLRDATDRGLLALGGHLDGIVHLAGTYHDRLLADESRRTVETVLRPKILGALALSELLKDRPDCLFVTFSSAVSFFGGSMVGAYAAANRFLEAFAHTQRRHTSLQSFCYGWTSWNDVGMSRGYRGKEPLRARGIQDLSIEQGLHSLLSGLSRGRQRLLIGLDGSNPYIRRHLEEPACELKKVSIYVSAEKMLPIAIREDIEVTDRFGTRVLCEVIPVRSLPRTDAGEIDRERLIELNQKSGAGAGEKVLPRSDEERQIATIWQSLLGLSRVGISDNFFELGGHSLLAMQVISRLRSELGVELSQRALFEAPTIAELARQISAARKGAPVRKTPSIERVSRDREMPLSFAQQRLWFIDKLEPGGSSYNTPIAFALHGSLNVDALQRALDEIVRRHEVLRTTFPAVDGRPVQIIALSRKQELPVVTLTNVVSSKREGEATRIACEEAQSPFNLACDPLIRTTLLRLEGQHHWLLVTMHHIVSDGWSLGVFRRELAELYKVFCDGKSSPLPALPIQFADYAAWQREWLRDDVLEDQLIYWKKQLTGAPRLLELPLDRPRPPVQSYRGSHVNFSFSRELSAKIKKICQSENATLFMTLMAAFQTLLARVSGHKEVVTGTAVANRSQRETEGLIGCLINVLLLRTDFAGNPTFRDLQTALRENALSAYAHQDLPFERLVEELHPQRDLSYNPLAQTMFVLLNEPVDQLELAGLRIESIDLEDAATQYDLILHMWEKGECLAGMLHYSTDLFEARTIQRFLGHFQRLLETVVDCPDQRVLDLPFLSDIERRQILTEWNDTAVAYPRDRCVHQLFEQQAAKNPDAIAVVVDDKEWSYGELDRRANQLARFLSNRGIGPDTLVALCVDRSLEMMVGLLGILKAGGAYVPLDPAYPKERLAFMLEDSEAPILLTQKPLVDDLPATRAELICLDADWDQIASESDSDFRGEATATNLAYVIYTSGSTGRPKGVEIPHRAVVNFLCTMTQRPGLAAHDRLFAVTTLSFDIAGLELFLPLTVGACVILAIREVAADGSRLIDALTRSEATVLQATPSTWRLMLDAGWRGNRQLKALCGGEGLPRVLADQLVEKCECLWNMYGPTETTIWSTVCRIDEGHGPIVIGKPIANTQVYILDSQMQPVPVGVAGELLIGGEGLARGYRNRPELTAEKFVRNPFGRDPASKLYRTGDLARWHANGMIECLGRLDFQVKIRGHRIELGDIEAALGNHPDVNEVVVVAREDVPGDKRLVAYLAVDLARIPSVAEIRRFLKDRLPESMIPSAFVSMHALPRTPNGKIDRNSLPAPSHDRPSLEQVFIAPQTPDEIALAEIWSRILKLERIGVHDNFFELGGQSLLATQVMWQLKDALNVELPVRALFESPTISGLAERLQSARESSTSSGIPALAPVSRVGDLPLSFAQQRFWFVNQLAPGNASHNLFAAHFIDGPLNVPALTQSVRTIVSRHEALRTVFPSIGGRPVQVIKSLEDLNLEVIDFDDVPKADRASVALSRARDEVRKPFDLANGPLLRTSLFRLNENESVFVLVMHHIVADGWSLGVFSRELAELYEDFSAGRQSSLMPLPIQYADYAVWQRSWLQGDVLQDQTAYWKDHLAGVPTLLELPTDRPRPPVQSFRGARHDFLLSRELSDALQALSRRQGVTLFMTLMSAFQVLLSRYSGQERFIVSTGIANRGRPETQGLIGCLINILLMQADLRGNPTFRDLLQRVRKAATGAFAHQDLPFERLVEELQPERDLSYNPLTQVMFVLLNEPMNVLELPGLRTRPIEVEADASPYDLVMHVWETPEGLAGFWHFSTDLFDNTTIARMLRHFQTLLRSIVVQPDGHLLDMPLLPEAELRQVALDWNDTRKDFPRDRCLHQLFEARAARNPESVAVIFGQQRLTYGELNRRANQLGHHLRQLGVGPDVLVGLCVERSIEMVVGILGTMKAGGAYVPLDPTYPLERLDFMLRDTNAPVLLTQKHLLSRLTSVPARVICLDTDWPEIAKELDDTPESGVGPQHLGYVIYTSGSTGTPKGIALRHQGVVNNIVDLNWRHEVGPNDRMLALSSLSFDMCVYEVFGTLEAGAAIVMPHPNDLREPARWAELMAEHRVTIWNSAPALLKMLVDYTESRPEMWPRHLHLAILGGDWVSVTLPDRLKAMAPRVRFIVLGGATEASIHSIIFPVEQTDPTWKSIPYGVPQYNQKAYILNSRLQPQPVGVAGELYLGGVGLARGYYNRPSLTADRFVPNPFATQPGERIYSTGDLARYRSDGVIELIGRMDYQVKLRGMRIECGEIEACLRQHSAVLDAIVVAKEFGGDKRLVAYVRPNPETAASVCRLVTLERSELPDGWQRGELPNGMAVVCRSKAEIEFSYKEIFEDSGYLRHGIEVHDGDCIFDVGANIGLFALSMARHCKSPVIYAFEPIPPVFDLLQANTAIHGLDATVLNCGISRTPGREKLTYYPHLSLLSGRFADQRAERETVRTFLSNERQGVADDGLLDELLDERMQTQEVDCEMKTLSQVFRETGVERVDLLKIDVEKAELEVLAGIEPNDWAKIQQVVVEVYDKDGRADWVTGLLESHGFQVAREQDEVLDETPYCNLFAIRADHPAIRETSPDAECDRQATNLWSSPEHLVNHLRIFVKGRLPEYMVPFSFVLMDGFPLSPNGKTDRKALPTPETVRTRSDATSTRPASPTEATLTGIWCEVLEIKQIGLDDNFFDLGGHSLLATQVISKVREAFQAELPLRVLFEAPTIAGLATRIVESQSESALQTVPLVPVSRNEELPLSFAQERLWFIDQLLPGSSSYNIPLTYRLIGPLQVDALKASLTEVVRRHESLRTCFPVVGDRPVQRIARPEAFVVSIQDLTNLSGVDAEVEALRLADAEARKPFDLAQGPLFRTQLIRIASVDHLLLVTLHHAVADGWSLNLFCQEVSMLYAANSKGSPPELIELPLQYADYAVWQRQSLQGSVLEEQVGFWKRQLAGAPLVLELPADRPRPPVQTLRGARHFFKLPMALAEQSAVIGRQAGTTPFMTLLAAFKTLLHVYTNRTDLLVGSPFANRTRTETEAVIGPFVNTVVLRTRLDNNPSFRELLTRVREVVLSADAHQEFPFEKIVEALRPPRDPSRNPVFQVNFRVVMSPLQPLGLSGVTSNLSVAPTINSKFDLALELWVAETEFGGYFEYCTDLFDETTAQQMANDFERLLAEVLANPDRTVSELALVQEVRARLTKGRGIAPKSSETTAGRGLRDIRRKAVNLSEPGNLRGKDESES